MDIENEKFQVIPYVGDDFESCSWGDMSACYWKESKIIVSGGYDYENENYCSTVAIITLKDLDSESIFFNYMMTILNLLRSICTLGENYHSN